MKLLNIILKIFLVIILIPLFGLMVIYLNFHFISLVSKGSIVKDSEKITFHEYTLLPGSGSYKPEVWTNHTLNNRLTATFELYSQHKTKKIIASGSKKKANEDESGDIKRALMEMGVLETDIILDTSGFRTWESIKNVKEKFGVVKLIIVSQEYHLERAVIISKCVGLDATGFVAADEPYRHKYWTYREYLARVKCIIDCFKSVFNFT